MRQQENTSLEAKYEALLRDFDKHIFRFCIANARTYEDRKPLMQDIMVEVWRGIGNLRATTARQTNRWLQQVMHSALYSYYSRRRLPPTLPLEAIGDVPDQTDTDTELLHELIAHLRLDEQTLVNRRLQGYTAAEIGRATGLSEDTVNQRMSRIKKKLRTIYDQLYGE